MADQVSVNSVQPSEISREMVAYLLTASILGGSQYGQGWYAANGLPLIQGFDKEAILSTYAECARTVRNALTDTERLARR